MKNPQVDTLTSEKLIKKKILKIQIANIRDDRRNMTHFYGYLNHKQVML